MSCYHLAQLNLGLFRAPLDDAAMGEFAAALDPINAIAEASAGFVWRLKADDGGSSSFVDVPGRADPLWAPNMSVWEDLDSLRHFMYKSGHASYLRRRTSGSRSLISQLPCCGGFQPAKSQLLKTPSNDSTTSPTTVPASTDGHLPGHSLHPPARREATCRHLIVAASIVTCNMGCMAAPHEDATVKRRVSEHRRRLRAQGLRPVQIWVPDVRAPGFTSEAHRQSAAVAASEHAADDQAFIDALSLDEE